MTKHKRPPTNVEKLKYLGDFISDGCSLAPDLVFFSCCQQHDIDYCTGVDRPKADKRLRRCIKRMGYPTLSHIYWVGVRLGGWWGYYFGPSAKQRRTYLRNLEIYNNVINIDD